MTTTEPTPSPSQEGNPSSPSPATSIPSFLQVSPEEREGLRTTARAHKASGNEHFKNKQYTEAISEYEDAIALLNDERWYERTGHSEVNKDENQDVSGEEKQDKEEVAVFHGNIGACYMMLEDWKPCVEACDKALKLNPDYIKVLSRRASANEKIGTWSSLSEALKDHQKITQLEPHNASSRSALARLPRLIEVQQEKEKEEMLGKIPFAEIRLVRGITYLLKYFRALGKLKTLGNSVLGKFGLSLDSFQMKPNEGGGYSLSMKQ
ncbi:hypothetical protein BC832DRAFT_568004 [Gaertneriomyces semiglobifer]|nr:hypothetical protein BC832DRAFT_568004 [Gaertneriomyces semiglobifer]